MNYESEIIFIDFFKNMNCITRLTIQSKVKIIANKAMLHSPRVNRSKNITSKHNMSKMVLKIIDTLHPVRRVIVLFCVMQDLICQYGTNMKKNEMNSPINKYMG